MKNWKIRNHSHREPGHSLPDHLPPAAVIILLARGIETDQQFQLFLRPPHRLPYCPMRLNGMDLAVQRILTEASKNKCGTEPAKMGIVGDFDVDGITGTALLVEGLEHFGLETVPYLPHRVSEGHGLSVAAVEFMAERGVKLIITVDCGVSSIDEVSRAHDLGIDVIVTDHHVPPSQPPKAVAIINPRIPGNEYPFPHLCGAGLALKLMQGLFQLRGQAVPPSLLELAAMGTIADLVPLKDENRYLVEEGLKQLSRTTRPGLKAMYRLSSLENKPITSETVAFQLAPRLNAAGRMGHAGDSLSLLTTRCQRRAEVLAETLESQNRERRVLTREVVDAVQAHLDRFDALPPFLVVENPGITPGIAGLVAGNLTDKYQRPAVALSQVDEDTFIGSGRSIPAFNLVNALDSCARLFVRHGGHAQAAGFTIRRDNIISLKEQLEQIATDSLAPAVLRPDLFIDAEIGLEELTPALLDFLDRLEPFGMGNPKPLFMTRGLAIGEVRKIGSEGQHLKLDVSHGHGSWTALIFNGGDRWPPDTRRVDLVYTVNRDSWRGKEQLSLVVEDFRVSDSAQ